MDNDEGRQHDEAPRMTSEREAVVRRFLDLATVDQLWVHETIARLLSLGFGQRVKLERRLEDRSETLKALRRVSEHLQLARPPTVQEYDRFRRQLGLTWSSARIIRVWGLWSQASAAAAGEPRRSTAAERAFRRGHLGSRRRREDALTAVRMWLSSAAASECSADYDAWAREYNLTVAPGTLPVPRQSTITRRLALKWKDLVAIARGETAHPEAATARRDTTDWSRGPHDLIGITTIAQILGLSEEAARRLVYREGFPRPVHTFLLSRRAWLRGDVEAYQRGEETVPRDGDELIGLYIEAKEYCDLVGMAVSSRHSDVEPIGRVGGRYYWLREEVEAWLVANEAKVAARKASRRQPGTHPAHPSTDFVDQHGLISMLGTTEKVVGNLVRSPHFPKPVATFGAGRLWLRRDIEAFMLGQPLPARSEGALQKSLFDARELIELLAYTRRRPYFPPPSGRAGASNYWIRKDVQAWLDEDSKRRKRLDQRRRRRQAPEAP